MIIYIDGSIAQYLESKTLDPEQERFYTELAFAHKTGRCLLCGDLRSIEALCKHLPQSGSDIYMKVAAKYMETPRLIKEVDYVLVLSYQDQPELPEFLNNKSIVIRIETAMNLRLHSETCIIGENIVDCEFYIHLGRRYLYRHNIKNVDVSMHKEQGGGSTTGNILTKCVSEEKMPTLCIADSDMRFGRSSKHPQLPGKGATAKAILRAEKNLIKHASYVPFHVSYLAVHEIENLIPLPVLESLLKHMPLMADGLNTLQRLKYYKSGEPILYYDFKEGFSTKSNDPRYLCYWDEVKAQTGIITFPQVSSGRLMEHAIKTLKKDRLINNLELDEYLTEHWTNIGRVVFSWGCVNEPIRA